MKQRVVALLGLSGVGKSTLLHQLADDIAFQHLQASALIKEAREAVQARDVSTDTLRHGNIDENQQLLIRGFADAVAPGSELVVLDGHSVIDTDKGLVAIESSVFGTLGVAGIVYLADVPTQIVKRRLADSGRQRPARSANEIREHQNVALLNAFKIALELGVPMTVLTPAQRFYLQNFLTDFGVDAGS